MINDYTKQLKCRAITKSDSSFIFGYPFVFKDKEYLICGMINNEPYSIEIVKGSMKRFICQNNDTSDIYESDKALINNIEYEACYNNVTNKFEWRNDSDYPIEILSNNNYKLIENS